MIITWTARCSAARSRQYWDDCRLLSNSRSKGTGFVLIVPSEAPSCATTISLPHCHKQQIVSCGHRTRLQHCFAQTSWLSLVWKNIWNTRSSKTDSSENVLLFLSHVLSFGKETEKAALAERAGKWSRTSPLLYSLNVRFLQHVVGGMYKRAVISLSRSVFSEKWENTRTCRGLSSHVFRNYTIVWKAQFSAQ